MKDSIVQHVQERYASAAMAGRTSRQPGVHDVAEAFGYSAVELASIPAESNLGLSCGNPTAYAKLRPGEVVVDLGCGGGLDVFLAAAKVGPGGCVVGIDMTPEMITLARRNAAKAEGGRSSARVEFHLAAIDDLPLPSEFADCVISNCVINLAPNKSAVFREAARVLKPGGRFVVSDIVLKKPLPPEIAADVAAYVGCISGALLIEDYRRGLLTTGFCNVVLTESGSDLNSYAKVEAGQGECCPPGFAAGVTSAVVAGCGSESTDKASPCEQQGQNAARRVDAFNVNEFAASVRIVAWKV